MLCPSCKTHYPDAVKCCSKCAVEFRWEYKESTIRLPGLNSNTPSLAERFNECVAKHLQEVGQMGWQPADPTDWESLLTAGRVKTVKASVAAGPPVQKFEIATIRLKRLHVIRGQQPVSVPDHSQPGIRPDEAEGKVRSG